jgi:glyoxylase-like metal-dependent hydrolase (beta-lactamase superfamily II)
MIGQEVDGGIGRIPGFVNAYVLEDPSGIYLIDTTISRTAKPVRRAFERAGADPGKVGTILLTHQHVDHVRGAAALEKQSHAVVACHAADAPFVDGRARPRMPALLRWFVRVDPVPVQRILGEGDSVGPFRVVFVPGHTAGEVAFYLPERRILFSGDSVVERRGVLTLPAARYAADLRQAVASLEILRKLEIELLLPGHGVPVRKDVAAKLDDLIARAPTQFLRQ